MKGQVSNGVHMIIYKGALSFVSLKFDVVTKMKYCLRVTSDLKFHISCNDCTVQPKEIKSLAVLDSVLMSCIQVWEILVFLETYASGKLSASTYTKSARELLNCVVGGEWWWRKLQKNWFPCRTGRIIGEEPTRKEIFPRTSSYSTTHIATHLI